MGKLTKGEASLLGIIAKGERPGFTPRIDHAHPKHQPTLHKLRAEGFVSFTWENPVMRITPAGREALAQPQAEGPGRNDASQSPGKPKT